MKLKACVCYTSENQPNFAQFILDGNTLFATIWRISCRPFCNKSADPKEGNKCSD